MIVFAVMAWVGLTAMAGGAAGVLVVLLAQAVMTLMHPLPKVTPEVDWLRVGQMELDIFGVMSQDTEDELHRIAHHEMEHNVWLCTVCRQTVQLDRRKIHEAGHTWFTRNEERGNHDL